MKKILTILSIVSLTYISAAILTTDKPIYTTTNTIKINFSEMDNHNKDWIAIYRINTSSVWKNVVKWAWTKNRTKGTLTFKNLPAGDYEVRAFYNNSYYEEARKTFKVIGSRLGVNIKLRPTKPVFQVNEDVKINFKNINGATNDWFAIYPANSNNDWKNVIKWKFNKSGAKEGQVNFDKLPVGKYEARIFYNNTFKMEGKVAFSVKSVTSTSNPQITITKPDFQVNEDVKINFKNINGATNDWFAIYPANSNNDWKNVIKWKFNKSGAKEGQVNFDKLPVGKYEARIFYNNTFKMEGKVAFKVTYDNNRYTKRFYTKNRNYSLAYKEKMPYADWYVLNKQNIVTDSGRIDSTPHNRASFTKLNGVDIFMISKDGSALQDFYRIKDGKLTNLNLKEPNRNLGRVEPRGHSLVTKDGKKILTIRYLAYAENKTYTYIYDVTDLENIKLMDDNYEDEEIIKLAKEHCLNSNNRTDKILCANEENIVYILKSYRINWQIMNNLYRVNITANNEKVDRLPDYLQERGNPLIFGDAYQINNLKGTTLITVIDNRIREEQTGVVVLLNRNGKKLLVAGYAEASLIFPSMKAFDNSQKLEVHSGYDPYYRPNGTQTKSIYDISDPNEAIILNEEIIEL